MWLLAVAAASPYGTCLLAQNNEHEFVNQNSFNLRAGSATTTIVQLHTCTTAPSHQPSFVLPVNLQGPGFYTAQIGYDAQSGGTMHFVYTPLDTNGDMQPFPGAPSPVIGRSYTFGIYDSAFFAGCSGTKWIYTLDDNATGKRWTACGTRSAPNAESMWSGFEVYDSNDQMGGNSTTGYAIIKDIQYANQYNWYWFTTTTLVRNCCDGTSFHEPWWQTSAYLYSGRTRVAAYTLAH